MKRFTLAAMATLLALGTFGAAHAEEIKYNKFYYGAELCGYEQFYCYSVKPGDTWEKLFPNAHERDLVKRLNRMNMAVRYRSWIVIPKDLKHLDILDLSPFPDKVNSHGEKMVVVNLKKQAFGAYDQTGQLVHWGPVSGAKGYCPDIGKACNTQVGEYRVIDKRGADCESNKFPVETAGGAPMPYCMFYYGGFALHASDLPGYHASHGCIRMFKEDAIWLNKEFTQIGTRVIVLKE